MRPPFRGLRYKLPTLTADPAVLKEAMSRARLHSATQAREKKNISDDHNVGKETTRKMHEQKKKRVYCREYIGVLGILTIQIRPKQCVFVC
jgi:hypothetical protein